MKYAAMVGDRSFEIEVDHDGLVWLDGQPTYVRFEQLDGMPLFSLSIEDSGQHVLYAGGGPGTYQIEIQGNTYPVVVKPVRPLPEVLPGPCDAENAGEAVVCAPLAGRLLDLPVAEGQRVEVGQVVVVLESMKMRIELRAPRGGIVDALCSPPGRTASQGEPLVLIRCVGSQSG